MFWVVAKLANNSFYIRTFYILTKNQINRNKTDNKAKFDNKNIFYVICIKRLQWIYPVGVKFRRFLRVNFI